MSLRSSLLRAVARLLPPAALLVGLAACSVPFDEQPTNLYNRCTTDDDCPVGVCLPTSSGAMCASTQADLGDVLLEVRSPSGLAGATSSFVFEDAARLLGSYPDGALLELALEVPPLVVLSGSMRAPGGPIDGCTADDGSLPVRVEARARSGYVGIEGSVYTVTSTPIAGSHRFALEVPIGTYDLHLSPLPPAEDCGELLLPPRLVTDVVVPAGVAKVELEPPSEPPSTLGGSLLVPSDGSVEGWMLEIVDPRYGLPLSRPLVLGTPATAAETLPIAEAGASALQYTFTQSAVLRLRSADGALAVHWSLAALDLDGDGEVELDLRDLIANPKSLVATVLDPSGAPISAATVTVQSLALTGDVNQNASFRVLAESDADGQLSVQLVPGTYAVSLVPASGDAATLVTEWIITESTQCCGKTFQLPKRSRLGGEVLGLDGAGLADATVFASPSLQEPVSYFSAALQPPPLLPRPTSTLADGSGRFELSVDPGMLDLSVRSDASTGYPWLVVPRVLVQGEGAQPSVELGRLGLLPPAVLQGRVSSAGVEVPRATVRAWLPVATPSQEGAVVPLVQIGETTADELGRFLLPVPPRITLSAPAAPAPR
jgi:hypothetical protein